MIVSENRLFDEMQGPWLSLADYSVKFKISVSTLRRRIKAEEIAYRFNDGKYFLQDQPAADGIAKHRPSQSSDDWMQPTAAPVESGSWQTFAKNYLSGTAATVAAEPDNSFLSHSTLGQDEKVLAAAHKLIAELKKAYSLILQEKEEQILHLKEEVIDLKTLVRVLESENDRLQYLKQ